MMILHEHFQERALQIQHYTDAVLTGNSLPNSDALQVAKQRDKHRPDAKALVC